MALIRELSVKTIERIIKLSQKENLTQFTQKMLIFSTQLCLKFGGSTKKWKGYKRKAYMGRWKTENSKDRIRNSKQYTGVTVCDRTVRNKGYV